MVVVVEEQRNVVWVDTRKDVVVVVGVVVEEQRKGRRWGIKQGGGEFRGETNRNSFGRESEERFGVA